LDPFEATRRAALRGIPSPASPAAQSVQQECLDHFVVFGERDLGYLLSAYLAHYHQERLHQAVGNVPPTAPAVPEGETGPPGVVGCLERLGGC
jgi:hypothetical protein